MKKVSLLVISLFMIFSVNAQTVITKDFNDYKEDAILLADRLNKDEIWHTNTNLFALYRGCLQF